MTQNLIRQVIRAHLEEASRARRQQTRATIAAASDLPTTKSGRVDLARQIALTGFNLAKETAGGPPRYGFTMTSIQKVGINPSSGFNTPLALYAYPVTPMMVAHLTGGQNLDIAFGMPEIEDEIPKYASVDYELPFVADAPFINFFGFNTTEGVYYTSTGMDEGKYRAVIDRLFRWLKDDSGLDVERPELKFRQLLVTAQNYNKPRANLGAPSPASNLSDYEKLATVWSMTRALSMVSVAADFDAMKSGGQTPTQSTISVWRSLLLMVGIKVVVDDAGKGLIHMKEPEQMAIMDTSIIEPIQQFDNATRAGKSRKESDNYWRNNPERAKSQIDQFVKQIAGAVERSRAEGANRDQEFSNLSSALAMVYASNWGRNKVKGEIRRLGLIEEIDDFALNMIPVIHEHSILYGPTTFAYLYDLTGDRRVVDETVVRLLDPIDQGFKTVVKHIYSISSDPDPVISKYIIALCESAFAKLSGVVSQYPSEADEMLHALAGSKIMAEAMNISQFRQLIGPIYKAMPDDMKSSSVESIASGRTVTRLDAYLELFGEYEVNKARGKEHTQIQALEKKKLYKPETLGLYANLGDIDKLQHRLNDVLRRAREELYRNLDILNDKAYFFKTGSSLQIDDYKLAPGRFIQIAIQSATPEQLQTVEAIWTRYTRKIRKATEGPPILEILRDISDQRPDLKNDDPEYAEVFKGKVYEHAQLQVAAIHEAIEDLEKEMRAQLDSMDNKGAETSPLYERLIAHWL